MAVKTERYESIEVVRILYAGQGIEKILEQELYWLAIACMITWVERSLFSHQPAIAEKIAKLSQ